MTVLRANRLRSTQTHRQMSPLEGVTGRFWHLDGSLNSRRRRKWICECFISCSSVVIFQFIHYYTSIADYTSHLSLLTDNVLIVTFYISFQSEYEEKTEQKSAPINFVCGVWWRTSPGEIWAFLLRWNVILDPERRSGKAPANGGRRQ